MMIHFADVMFCKIVTQISIKFCGHQSSNWFNDFVTLSPITNDLDKKHPKIYLLILFLFVLISSRFTHTALSSYMLESHPMPIPEPKFPFATKVHSLKSSYLHVQNAILIEDFCHYVTVVSC